MEANELSGSRITELEQVKAALKESENRYMSLFFMAGEGIFFMTTQGKLVEVNESFARMHGYSVEEMSGMSLKDLDTPETARMVISYHSKFQRTLFLMAASL